ncbi:MAG: hypothetical protein AAFR61_20990 [Bacteroidota bacterium]
MKAFSLTLLLVALVGSFAIAQKTEVTVPANDMVVLDYPEFAIAEVTIKNKSMKGLDVAVLSKDTDEQVRGFGLGTQGKVEVMVERENKLVFKNTGNSKVKLHLSVASMEPQKLVREGQYIDFTLKNNSAKSIPLLIPSVMNPNLSPFSNSGVSLKVGQKILFRMNGKKHVLLVVDDKIQEGDVIEVSSLLKARKKELGLKK